MLFFRYTQEMRIGSAEVKSQPHIAPLEVALREPTSTRELQPAIAAFGRRTATGGLGFSVICVGLPSHIRAKHQSTPKPNIRLHLDQTNFFDSFDHHTERPRQGTGSRFPLVLSQAHQDRRILLQRDYTQWRGQIRTGRTSNVRPGSG